MDNCGMTFELVLEPFVMAGEVGSRANILMRQGSIFDDEPIGVQISGRKDIEELIDKLYKLQEIAADINGNKGAWAYSFAQTEQAKESGSDGVHVQDMA